MSAAIERNIRRTGGVNFFLKGECFSMWLTNAASRAMGVFFGGVLEWPPSARATKRTSA